jgi:hypothetical protein
VKSFDSFGLLTVKLSAEIDEIDPDLFNTTNVNITLVPAMASDEDSMIDKSFTW